MNLRSAAAAATLNCKKVKQDGGQDGYDYSQNLPDELIVEIFTKLSSGKGLNTLDDIKSLGHCSAVSKRFNSLTSLVPYLSISHRSIAILYFSCPNILDKFKHIRSLHLEYRADTTAVDSEVKHIPYILTKAMYDPPHNYSLAVLSSISIDVLDQQEHSLTPSLITADTEDEKEDIIYATKVYASALFHLHHMLLSSIRDHKLLQKVVVTDWNHCGSFTLVEEQLLRLRNINANVPQVQGCLRSGFSNVLSVPLSDGQVLFKNTTFSLVEKWQEDSTGRRHDGVVPQLDGNEGKVCNEALERMLKMEADLSFDYEFVPKYVHENNWV